MISSHNVRVMGADGSPGGNLCSLQVQEGDVMSQILSVMNAHLSSLQYLEDRSTKIKVKLGDLSRLSEAVQRETLSLQSRRVGRF